jgi:hypothetical protein
MKLVVIYLNDSNELVMFNHSILGNYSSNNFFGYFTLEIPLHAESNTQYEILHLPQIVDPYCNIVGRPNDNFDV